MLAQIKQRKAANIARQEVLRKERAAALGDPVRGITTPFVQSFDNPADAAVASSTTSTGTQEPSYLNYFLSPNEVKAALEQSKSMAEPVKLSSNLDPAIYEADMKKHEEGHKAAEEAINRIVNLSLGNSKSRTRVNIQRCIETFGRHNTDSYLAPRTPANVQRDPSSPAPQKTPRVGPDTGSSEVQAAILTAKIRALANHLETRGRTDKVNKRNLRILVHRRQKHLKYLRKQDRGGARWTNLIEKLGLTEGTWKGEISLS
jgi:ribosomal protein S15